MPLVPFARRMTAEPFDDNASDEVKVFMDVSQFLGRKDAVEAIDAEFKSEEILDFITFYDIVPKDIDHHTVDELDVNYFATALFQRILDYFVNDPFPGLRQQIVVRRDLGACPRMERGIIGFVCES